MIKKLFLLGLIGISLSLLGCKKQDNEPTIKAIQEVINHNDDGEYVYVTLTIDHEQDVELRAGLMIDDTNTIKKTFGSNGNIRKVLTTIGNGTKDLFSQELDWKVTNGGKRLTYSGTIKLNKADLDASSRLILYAIVGSRSIQNAPINAVLPLMTKKPTEVDIPHVMVTDLKRIGDTRLAIKDSKQAIFNPIGNLKQIHIKNESPFPLYLTGIAFAYYHSSTSTAHTPPIGNLILNNHGEITRDMTEGPAASISYRLENSTQEDYIILPAGAERSDIVVWSPDTPSTQDNMWSVCGLLSFGSPITMMSTAHKKEGIITHLYGTVKNATTSMSSNAFKLPSNLDLQLIETPQILSSPKTTYHAVPYTSADGKKLLFTSEEANSIEKSFKGKKYIPNVYQMAYYLPFIHISDEILIPIDIMEMTALGRYSFSFTDFVQFPGSTKLEKGESIIWISQQTSHASPFAANAHVPFLIYALRFANDRSRSFLQRWIITPGLQNHGSVPSLNNMEGSSAMLDISFLPFDPLFPSNRDANYVAQYWLSKRDQATSVIFSLPYYKQDLFASQGIFQNTTRTTLESVFTALLCRKSSTDFMPLLVSPWGLGGDLNRRLPGQAPDKYPLYLFNVE